MGAPGRIGPANLPRERMTHDNDLWSEAQRRRFMRPNAHLWIRPDAYRFMAPDTPRLLGKDAVGYFWPRRSVNQSAQFFESKYSPDQPRDDHGRWVDWDHERERHVRLAGEIPTNEPPEIPKDRPATVNERNQIARQFSRNARLRGFLGIFSEAANWLREYAPEIVADQDPPKTLQELQNGALNPKKGYDIHHIVEQTPARTDGFEEDKIEGSENRVLVPRFQHERITAWFKTKNDDFNGMSPRDYLRDKGWDERTRVGLDALALFRVLRR